MLFLRIKFFYKIWRGLELISLLPFLHNFWRTILLLLYSMNWPNFIFSLHSLLEILLVNMSIVIICCTACDVKSFKINHNFLIKPFSYMNKKSGQRSWEKKDRFSSLLKGLREWTLKLLMFFVFPPCNRKHLQEISSNKVSYVRK